MKAGVLCGAAVALLLAAAGAASAASPSTRGSLAFVSSRCEQGGVRYEAPDPYHPPAGSRCNAGVFRARADGSGIKRLTGTDPSYRDLIPTWSPGGTQIAFVRMPAGSNRPEGRVMAMDADGTNVHEMLPLDAPGTSEIWALAWSPVGDKIAFISESFGLAWADVATGAIHSIPRHGLGIGWPITFSPDGTKLATIGRHVDPQNPDNYDVDTSDLGVWIMDLSGDHQERLTVGGVRMTGDGYALSPDWRYLAFTLWDTTTTDIGDLWTIKLDGTELTRRSDVTFAQQPVLSPFGPTLFFTDRESGSSSIRRVDLAQGGPSQAVTNPPQGTGDGYAAWTPRDDMPEPPADGAPAVVLGSDLGVTPAAGAPSPARAKSSAAPPGDRLPFLAMDRSGVRRIDVALAKRVKGHRCRFLHDENLGHTTSCGKPHYFRYENPKVWKRHLRKLAAGKYVIRFRTTDAKGHRTKHPKPRTVRLR